MPKDTTPDPEVAQAAKDAVAKSDGPEMLTVSWRDQDWIVPASGDDWSFDAALALEQGRVLVFLGEILGNEQLRRFRASKPSAKDAAQLVDAVTDAMRLGLAGK